MKEKIAKFMARPITYGAFGMWKVNRSVKSMDDARFPDEDLEGDEE